MQSSPLSRGCGTTSIYGTTPALDLLDQQDLSASEPLKILMVAANDARHLLKTIGNQWALQELGKRRPLHIYVTEPQAPLLARLLLQLSLIFDQQFEELSMQERAETWLELYGNCFLREKVAQLLSQQAHSLIKVITEDDERPQWSKHLMDLSQLKFRERDDLEFTCQFWRNDKKAFDMEKLRDFRLRAYYGVRYDARENLFDWDYQMKLKDKAPIVHHREFNRWRETGIAFEVRDSNYNHSNRSMATVDGLKEGGLTVTKWGFFSDIVLSPYIGFGIESDSQSFFKKRNETFMHTSQEVAEYNVRKFLQQLHTGSAYDTEKLVTITDVSEEVKDVNPLAGLRITLLPCELQQAVVSKAKYQNFFDVIYLGNMMAHRIPDMTKLLRSSRGKLFAENAMFLLDLTEEQVRMFHRKMMEMAQASHLKLLDGIRGHHFIYQHEHKNEE